MEQSLFIQFVQKYFPGIVVSVVEKLNDTKLTPTYLHRRMLRKDFSVSGKWESINATNTLVAADVVAMDSPLPLKKRDSVGKASGDIPKMGMELKLNEQQLTNLDTLIAQNGGSTSTTAVNAILAKLFSDTPKVIGGVFERLEAMFLQGLSSGVTLVEDTENVGTGVRVDYGYLSANKFTVDTLWSSTSAKPFDDIKVVLDKAAADGNTITKVMLDRDTLENIGKTTQAKELYAFEIGFVGSTTPALGIEQLNKIASNSRYGFTFEVVDRSIRYEKDGTQTTIKPWTAGAVVFLVSDQVGSLTWARLAEENHPVDGVTYQKADDFVLVSKYRMNKPSLSEYTSSQARVVPVIANVDRIYLLDSTTVTTT